MLDIRQSPQWKKYQQSLGWHVERINSVNYAIRKIPLLGNILKIQRPKQLDNKTTTRLARKYKPFQIIIEPALTTIIRSMIHNNSLYENGFKLSKSPYLPTKTIHLDLTKPENELVKEMHYKTRYNINKSLKSKVKIQKSEDIELFIRFYHQWHRKRLLFLSQAKQIREIYLAFGKDAHIFMAVYKNEFVAELLTINYQTLSYYMFAASSQLGKKLFAPTLLTWVAIREAKKRGCIIFDFEGIYDDRYPLKSWLGFTRFKQSFGGKKIDYPGCFIKTNFRAIISHG